jgi:hypothetical protein
VIAWQEEASELEAGILRALPGSRSAVVLGGLSPCERAAYAGRVDSFQNEPPKAAAEPKGASHSHPFFSAGARERLFAAKIVQIEQDEAEGAGGGNADNSVGSLSGPDIDEPQGGVDLSNSKLEEARQASNGHKASRSAKKATLSKDLMAEADVLLADGTFILTEGIGSPPLSSAARAPSSAPSTVTSGVAQRTLICLERAIAKPGAPPRAIQRAAAFTEMQKLINSYAPDIDATELRELFDACDSDQVIMHETAC